MNSYLVELLEDDAVVYSFVALGVSIPAVLSDELFIHFVGKQSTGTTDGLRIGLMSAAPGRQ